MALHHADMLMYVKKKIPFFVATHFEPILLLALNAATEVRLATPLSTTTQLHRSASLTRTSEGPSKAPLSPQLPTKTPSSSQISTNTSPLSQPTSIPALTEPKPTLSPLPPIPKPTDPRTQIMEFQTSRGNVSSLPQISPRPSYRPKTPTDANAKPKRLPVLSMTDNSSLLDLATGSPRSVSPIEIYGWRVRLVDLTSKSLVTESTRIAHSIYQETPKQQGKELPSWW